MKACIMPLEKASDGRTKKERVQVSLTDCLACSGCVTSAETVLINQQSHEEFLKVLSQRKEGSGATESNAEESYLTVVVSLSHQVIASFAVQYEIGFQEAADRLASFFKSLGVDYVFDLTLARHLALIEAGREFAEVWSGDRGDSSAKKLPILSSVCPGWVCYVEKTHGNLVPLLSHIKSPQQIMGSIVKDVWCKEKGIRGRIHHVTIMPCFDKKLEASRRNFTNPETADKDVDSVLTPIEIQQILDARGISFPGMPVIPDAVDLIHALSRDCVGGGGGGDDSESNDSRNISSHYGSGSGGHAENVLVYAARRLLHRESLTYSDLKYETRRNADFLEILVSDCDGDRKLHFAIVNGFRNIQTLVQKLKRGKCEYDFVEIMACPSGCLNGGAQLKPVSDGVGGNRGAGDPFAERIRDVYRSLSQIDLPLESDTDPVKGLYDHWFPTPEIRNHVFLTEFKAVPKTENLLTMTW